MQTQCTYMKCICSGLVILPACVIWLSQICVGRMGRDSPQKSHPILRFSNHSLYCTLYMYRLTAGWPDIQCKTSCNKAQAIGQPNRWQCKQAASCHVKQLSGELAVCCQTWWLLFMWSCDMIVIMVWTIGNECAYKKEILRLTVQVHNYCKLHETACVSYSKCLLVMILPIRV